MGEKIRSGSQLCALEIKKPGSRGQVCANPRDTQTGPTFSRAGLGAGKWKFLELPPRVKQAAAGFVYDWRHIDIRLGRVHLGSEFAACWQESCLSGSPDATANSTLFFSALANGAIAPEFWALTVHRPPRIRGGSFHSWASLSPHLSVPAGGFWIMGLFLF